MSDEQIDKLLDALDSYVDSLASYDYCMPLVKGEEGEAMREIVRRWVAEFMTQQLAYRQSVPNPEFGIQHDYPEPHMAAPRVKP